jgi:hypothetical protein
VVGRIERCQAIVDPAAGQYVAGTVRVLRGVVRWQPIPGGSQAILPSDVVATQSVGSGDSYTFDLSPGMYVLQAPEEGFRMGRWTEVVVKAGATTKADIPKDCI